MKRLAKFALRAALVLSLAGMAACKKAEEPKPPVPAATPAPAPEANGAANEASTPPAPAPPSPANTPAPAAGPGA